jgi:hypothetical protein
MYGSVCGTTVLHVETSFKLTTFVNKFLNLDSNGLFLDQSIYTLIDQIIALAVL